MAESLGGKLETILVVDDTPSVLKVVAEILKTANFVVLEASSGPDALKLAAGRTARGLCRRWASVSSFCSSDELSRSRFLRDRVGV